ncbi:RNase P/MRP, p29 subunit [Auriculariales sp. MPI-PUGE-AT-0066]|nr:RNase P/MRP, p29 subunit [Auriculariales sp. MPI-PUGE-AT-0066]
MSTPTIVDPYQPLPPIKGTRVRFESSAPFTPVYVEQKLAASKHSPAEYYENRVKNRTLNLDKDALFEARRAQLATERKARREKDAQRRATNVRNAAGPSKMPKVNGLWTLAPQDARWSVFFPLHTLWLGYIAELLNLPHRPLSLESVTPAQHTQSMPSTQDMQAKLVKADFHGCIISVRRAKNPFLVGRTGIIVHETENTFKIVTLIPKRNSVFGFSLPLYGPPPVEDSGQLLLVHTPEPEIEFELYGNQFCYKASDRASRKFKHKETIELG